MDIKLEYRISTGEWNVYLFIDQLIGNRLDSLIHNGQSYIFKFNDLNLMTTPNGMKTIVGYDILNSLSSPPLLLRSSLSGELEFIGQIPPLISSPSIGDEVTMRVRIINRGQLIIPNIQEQTTEINTPRLPTCECGSKKLGSPYHSDWCPLYGKN